MKKIFTLVVFAFICNVSLYAQVVLQRASNLMPQLYTIEGQAFLEELSDGQLILRLSEDFSTPPGPDVRILLGNSLSINGAEEVINLSGINHFNGANSFDVPSSIDIEDFDYILFYCVNFQQFWASGSFGEATNPNGSGFSCEESSTNISSGGTSINICPTDNESDIVNFNNSLEEALSNYAYLITDEDDLLQEVVMDNNYDFEGSSASTQRVHGIHYDGTLVPMIGIDRLQTTATECFTHSGATGFITINKTANCDPEFECKETLTATTDWLTEVNLCTTDGVEDFVVLRNNVFEPAGENYVYLITDESEVLQEVVHDSIYNFEGTGESIQRVYGLSYSGVLDIQLGQNRMNTTASNCYIHSGESLFLTVNRVASCGVTSINETQLNQAIEIFPNPSNGLIAINYNTIEEVNRIEVFDNNGKRLQERGQVNQIEISNSGIYFIRFITDKETTTKKVFVR